MMPMHDWTRVNEAIYHDFHLEWILRISRSLTTRLSDEYYALAEQHMSEFGPEVVSHRSDELLDSIGPASAIALEHPKTRFFHESASEFYQRKQNSISIRHVSGDRVIAMIEIVSPGNKNSAHGLRAFVQKVRELLVKKVHLLIIDPFPVGPRDPDGLHALIFEDNPLQLTAESPLSAVSYECDDSLRAYLEPFAVGDRLTDMPIFLYPGMYVKVPLEETYMDAWKAEPRRWQEVIAPAQT